LTDKAATIRTVDGRKLAYMEGGDPNGAPVFYFHGLPGSRSDFDRPLGHEALAGSGVRVIGVDRPGFGASDFQPGRRYDDWPADVATVADALGVARFGVLGYSAGGPYVVACARALADRLTFAGIVSGVGPAETPRFRHRMAKTEAIMTRLARVAPAPGAPRDQAGDQNGRAITREVLTPVRQGPVGAGSGASPRAGVSPSRPRDLPGVHPSRSGWRRPRVQALGNPLGIPVRASRLPHPAFARRSGPDRSTAPCRVRRRTPRERQTHRPAWHRPPTQLGALARLLHRRDGRGHDGTDI
jgi:pimeloyl-ACP methyl ester carboxylesterase